MYIYINKLQDPGRKIMSQVSCVDGWIHGITNERTREQTNERTNEYINLRIGKKVKVRNLKTVSQVYT